VGGGVAQGRHREADQGMVADGEEGAVARKKRRDLVGTGDFSKSPTPLSNSARLGVRHCEA
jgi:hypothetical protein